MTQTHEKPCRRWQCPSVLLEKLRPNIPCAICGHTFKQHKAANVTLDEQLVSLPQTEAQAELTAKAGILWLKQHAPQRLRPSKETLVEQYIATHYQGGTTSRDTELVVHNLRHFAKWLDTKERS